MALILRPAIQPRSRPHKLHPHTPDSTRPQHNRIAPCATAASTWLATCSPSASSPRLQPTPHTELQAWAVLGIAQGTRRPVPKPPAPRHLQLRLPANYVSCARGFGWCCRFWWPLLCSCCCCWWWW